jgi:DNA-binding NtrC family response regulator
MSDNPRFHDDWETRPIQGRTVFSVPCVTLRREGATDSGTFLSNLVKLGSGEECHFVLDSDTVSREHAVIMRRGDSYLICDNDSTNGVYVDDVRVREAYLQPGALIRLGEESIRFSPGDEVLHARTVGQDRLGALVGGSPAMQQLFGLLEQVAPTDASVMLHGETGTGKELVARTIHDLSFRCAGPFVVVDCSALPPALVESELFGHERGSFSGAIAGRKGLLEAAHKGTLFVDEIGELPLDLQPRLLRALETGEVRRVGSNLAQRFDFRLLAATHRNLPRLVRDGRFREDLYFRINVVPLAVPPLRERPEDIPLLVRHLLDTHPCNSTSEGNKRVASFAGEVLECLQKHSFPGNVRELSNIVSREVALATGATIDTLTFPLEDGQVEDPPELSGVLPSFGEAKAQAVRLFETEYLALLMETASGNLSRAAQLAGMDRKYLRQLLKRYDMYEAPKLGPRER